MTGEELARELDALRKGAALAAAPPRDLLELSGADRIRLLHGLVTQEVRKLAPGDVAAGFFADRQGKILADFVALQGESATRLLLPEGRGAAIAAHLEKYRLASEVEIRPLAAPSALELLGPRAGELLANWSGEPAPLPGRAQQLEGDGSAIEALALPGRRGAVRYLLLPEARELEVLSATWTQGAGDLGLHRVSAAAREVARIEDGDLRFGVDFGEENLPQETGCEELVSYTKGCYLGQEVIARIHLRGGVQRRPFGLRFPEGLPAIGAVVLHDGRPAGRATSVALSPRFGAVGLGILHRRVTESPGPVSLESGARVEVAELPFA